MDTTAKLTLPQLIKMTSEAFLEEFKRKPIHAASLLDKFHRDLSQKLIHPHHNHHHPILIYTQH